MPKEKSTLDVCRYYYDSSSAVSSEESACKIKENKKGETSLTTGLTNNKARKNIPC